MAVAVQAGLANVGKVRAAVPLHASPISPDGVAKAFWAYDRTFVFTRTGTSATVYLDGSTAPFVLPRTNTTALVQATSSADIAYLCYADALAPYKASDDGTSVLLGAAAAFCRSVSASASTNGTIYMHAANNMVYVYVGGVLSVGLTTRAFPSAPSGLLAIGATTQAILYPASTITVCTADCATTATIASDMPLRSFTTVRNLVCYLADAAETYHLIQCYDIAS